MSFPSWIEKWDKTEINIYKYIKTLNPPDASHKQTQSKMQLKGQTLQVQETFESYVRTGLSPTYYNRNPEKACGESVDCIGLNNKS